MTSPGTVTPTVNIQSLSPAPEEISVGQPDQRAPSTPGGTVAVRNVDDLQLPVRFTVRQGETVHYNETHAFGPLGGTSLRFEEWTSGTPEAAFEYTIDVVGGPTRTFPLSLDCNSVSGSIDITDETIEPGAFSETDLFCFGQPRDFNGSVDVDSGATGGAHRVNITAPDLSGASRTFYVGVQRNETYIHEGFYRLFNYSDPSLQDTRFIQFDVAATNEVEFVVHFSGGDTERFEVPVDETSSVTTARIGENQTIRVDNP